MLIKAVEFSLSNQLERCSVSAPQKSKRKRLSPFSGRMNAVVKQPRPQIANGTTLAAQAHDQTFMPGARNPSADSIDKLRLNRSDLGFRKNAEPPRNLRVRVDQVSELIFKHLVSQHFPGFEIP